jgi:crotonobetainyl-CoA:carnitine CoA-transferase CaiB-like acyl-CoA transferase
MNIAAGSPAMWEKLARELGREDWLNDGRFADPIARIQHRAELSAEIEGEIAKADVGHWVARLNQVGVPSGPVLDMEQVFSDPQVLARAMRVELPHPEVGTFKTTGLPVKLSRNPGEIERRPPLLGEHTEQVLLECGLTRGEIDRLKRDEVI